ncbi:MAG: ComEC family competence protein [Dehalococcoidales bacterium]|nr:ComEC family competence protein [Dehalococcoidales bacterium]
MTLIYLGCAWIAGIFAGAGFNPPLALFFTGLAPLPFLCHPHHNRRTVVVVSLCIFAFFGGALYFQSVQPAIDEGYLAFYNDRGTVAVKGLVSAEPEIRDRTIHLRLSASAVEIDGVWHEVSGTALVFTPRYPGYSYGDELLVIGKPVTPSPLDDFDYPAYLANQGIHTTMLYPQIEVTGSGRGLKPLAWVYSIRESMSQTLARVLPEPQASLAQGITLGIRSNIPDAVKDNFSHTGTAHLLAISGLHLSILAGILVSAGIRLFGKRHYHYVWLAMGVIWLYVLITGVHPPVVRAAIMASLFLLSELLGRQRSAIAALVMAAAVMVGVSPQILWTASFQMSFMAMVGLIFVTPRFQSLGKRLIRAKTDDEGQTAGLAGMINDAASVSLGAIIGVGPLVAYYFGIISLVGPPVTFLALPALPVIIISGALAGGFGFIALPLAQFFGWLAWLPLSYLLLIVNAFAAVPVAFIEVSAIHPGIVTGYYLALALGLWFHNRHRRAGILAAQYATITIPGDKDNA